MPKNRISQLVALVVIMLISGCAHKPTDSVMTASQAGAANASVVEIDPSNPDDIIALGQRLTQKREAVFSLRQDKYTFYVGGVLNATYETTTKILRIFSLTPEDKIDQVCEYSPQGVLFTDNKDQTDKDALVNSCNRLVLLLNDFLAR
jgi:hypothetical protein